MPGTKILWGQVIIVFALIIKLLLWPLTAVSYRNAAKMRELQQTQAAAAGLEEV